MREAQLFQYVVCSAHFADAVGETGRLGTEELHGMAALVRDLYQELKCPQVLPFPERLDADLETVGRQIIWPHPSAAAPAWQEASGDRALYAVAYMEDGAIVLQRAVGQKGDANDSTFAHLRGLLRVDGARRLPESLAENRFVLGEFLCYGGRVRDEAEALARAELALIAPPGLRQPLRIARLDEAWLLDRPGLSQTFALFCLDDDAVEERCARFYNEIFPSAAVFLLKISHQYARNYKNYRRRVLRDLEVKLALALNTARLQPAEIEPLERALSEVVGCYAPFAAELAKLDDLRNTVQINAAKLRKLLGEHSMPRVGLPEAWRAVTQSAEDQLEADNGYYQARIRETEVGLRVLQTRTELVRAKAEQRENQLTESRNQILALFGLLVAVGGAILTFVSDDTTKALIYLLTGRQNGYDFWDLVLYKSLLLLLILAVLGLLTSIVWCFRRQISRLFH